LLKFRRRGREIALYLVTLLGCFSLLLSGQATAYAQCATDWTCQIVDSSGDVGEYTSLAFDASGKPAISYYEFSNSDPKLTRDLKFAYDRDDNGVFEEISTVDSAGSVGSFTSLAFGSGPAISYYDGTNGDLKFAYDRDDNGVFEVIITVDSSGVVGTYTSLAFDASGKPAISYYDDTNGDVKLAYDRSNDLVFSGANEIVTVDNDGNVGV